MAIWIDDSTKLRVNIHAPYKGFSRLDTPENRSAANVVKVASPLPPIPTEGFTLEEEYYRTEQVEFPYVTYVRKSEEQLEAVLAGKQARIDREEAEEENKADLMIKFLTTKSADKIQKKLDKEITDLESAKAVLVRLAIAVGILLRS